VIGHVWRHATRQDLEDARVYVSIRDRVAGVMRPHVKTTIEGAEYKRPFHHIYAYADGSTGLA